MSDSKLLEEQNKDLRKAIEWLQEKQSEYTAEIDRLRAERDEAREALATVDADLDYAYRVGHVNGWAKGQAALTEGGDDA